jgi:hypothetical protein
MMGGTHSVRSRFVGIRSRTHAVALTLAVVAVVAAGCDSGTVVNTDDARPTLSTSTSATPPLPTPTANDALANAFDFAAPQPDGQTGYYFTSPSKRWVCAITPRGAAGCQAATGSRIPIKGAPDTVPAPDGTDGSPNAIEVGRDTEPRFADLDQPGYSLVPGPAVVLPFGKLLIVAGFRCNVQEATGISCASELTGEGFTFSADGYAFRYTDLPA